MGRRGATPSCAWFLVRPWDRCICLCVDVWCVQDVVDWVEGGRGVMCL
jgi:hypothetical protein